MKNEFKNSFTTAERNRTLTQMGKEHRDALLKINKDDRFEVHKDLEKKKRRKEAKESANTAKRAKSANHNQESLNSTLLNLSSSTEISTYVSDKTTSKLSVLSTTISSLTTANVGSFTLLEQANVQSFYNTVR